MSFNSRYHFLDLSLSRQHTPWSKVAKARQALVDSSCHKDLFSFKYKPMISGTFVFQMDTFTRRYEWKTKARLTWTLERNGPSAVAWLCLLAPAAPDQPGAQTAQATAKQHLAVARSVQTGKAPAVPAGWRLHGDLCGMSFEKELSPTSSLQQHKGFETLYLGKQDGFGVSYHF